MKKLRIILLIICSLIVVKTFGQKAVIYGTVYDEKLKPPGLYNIAIEIVKNKISKINIYHRHYLTKSSIDEI